MFKNKLILPAIIIAIIAILVVVIAVFFPSIFGGVAGQNLTSSKSSVSKSVPAVSVPQSSNPTQTIPPSPNIPLPLPANNNSAPVSTSPTSAPAKISLQDLSVKNSVAECWTSLNGKVYNITAYIPRHPGGEKAISGACGGDLAKFSASHPGGSFDSAKLQGLLTSYQIGELE